MLHRCRGLARVRRRREGAQLVERCWPTIVDGTAVPESCTAPTIAGSRLPLRIRRSGCARAAGFSPRDRASRSPTSTSAASATTGSITATRSATARIYSFPGAEINEIGGRNFVKSIRRMEPAALALPPRRARPGFYATWLRPALFVGGLATNLDDDGVRAHGSPLSAARSTCASRSCRPRPDAVGRRRASRSRTGSGPQPRGR